MDRVAAYSVITEEIEAARRLPYGNLVARVGNEPATREIVTPVGVAILETRVEWENRATGQISVVVTLYGPSTFRLERLEERILVAPM